MTSSQLLIRSREALRTNRRTKPVFLSTNMPPLTNHEGRHSLPDPVWQAWWLQRQLYHHQHNHHLETPRHSGSWQNLLGSCFPPKSHTGGIETHHTILFTPSLGHRTVWENTVLERRPAAGPGRQKPGQLAIRNQKRQFCL